MSHDFDRYNQWKLIETVEIVFPLNSAAKFLHRVEKSFHIDIEDFLIFKTLSNFCRFTDQRIRRKKNVRRYWTEIQKTRPQKKRRERRWREHR